MPKHAVMCKYLLWSTFFLKINLGLRASLAISVAGNNKDFIIHKAERL